MKHSKIILLIIFTISLSCNDSQEESRRKMNTNDRYLLIEGNKIAIKEYPPDGKLIFRLDDKSKCKIIEKGEKQTILGVTDYWYKVEYRKVEGWVFGAQTSEKLERITHYEQIFSFNRQTFNFLEELQYYKNEWLAGIGETGCPVKFNSIFPLGWSKDGKIAYLKVENTPSRDGDKPIKTFLVIQNLDNDEVLENINIYTNNTQNSFPGSNCMTLSPMPKDNIIKIRKHLSIENSNTAWQTNKSEIKQLMDKYGIIKSNSFTLANKIKANRHSYSTEIELISDGVSGSYVKIYLVRDDLKRKLINKNKSISTSSNNIYAYILINPYNTIEGIVYVDNDPYETNLTSKIIGTNLNYGFK